MIILIDNYDSFVYNLARYIIELGYPTRVIRNDKITIAELAALRPSHIVISPGPCTPNEAGICLAAIRHFKAKLPLLGVCLGHQAIGHAFGAKVARAHHPLHGKSSAILHNQQDIFSTIPSPFSAARYHSLIVCEDNFPSCLTITARSPQGEIMALQHKTLPIFGVQFHPESVLTEHGYTLLKNFLMLTKLN